MQAEEICFLKYIGNQPRKDEPICRTKTVWNHQGDIQPVPKWVAQKLLPKFKEIWEDVTSEIMRSGGKESDILKRAQKMPKAIQQAGEAEISAEAGPLANAAARDQAIRDAMMQLNHPEDFTGNRPKAGALSNIADFKVTTADITRLWPEVEDHFTNWGKTKG